MEAVMKRLGEMSQLLLALNDHAVASNRRFDRLDDTLSDIDRRLDRVDTTLNSLVREARRNSDRLQTVELRIAELAVRLAAVEE